MVSAKIKCARRVSLKKLSTMPADSVAVPQATLALMVHRCPGLLRSPSLLGRRSYFPTNLAAARGATDPSNREAAAPTAAFDRGLFDRTARLACLRVPTADASTAVSLLQADLLAVGRKRRVVDDPSDPSGAFRLVLLGEHVAAGGGGPLGLEGLSPRSAEAVAARAGRWAAARHDLALGYGDVGVPEALRALLPKGVAAPSGFEAVGHLAHVNLREDQLPHRHLIGQVADPAAPPPPPVS